MVATMSVRADNMKRAAGEGFINATDLADYLTKKGVPFRAAYKTVGKIVGDCVKSGKTLDEITLEEYKAYSDIFDGDLYAEISLEACVNKRISKGGTGKDSVLCQIEFVENKLKEEN